MGPPTPIESRHLKRLHNDISVQLRKKLSKLSVIAFPFAFPVKNDPIAQWEHLYTMNFNDPLTIQVSDEN